MGWGGFEVNKLYETSNIKNVCMQTWTTADFHFLTVLDKKQRQKFQVSGHYRVQLTFTLGPAPAGVVRAGQEAAAGRDPVLGVGVRGVHRDLTVAAWWRGVSLYVVLTVEGGHSVLPSLYYITLNSRGWAGCSLHWLVAAGCWDAGPGLVTAGLASPGLQHGSSQLTPLPPGHHHHGHNPPPPARAHVPSFPPILQVLSAPGGQGR